MDLTGRLEVEPGIDGLRDVLELRGGRLRRAEGRPRASLRSGRGWWRAELGLLGVHGKLRWGSSPRGGAHTVGRDPARAVNIGLNLLASQLLGNIGYPDPHHADGNRMLGRLVVNGELDFVGPINLDGVILGLPTVQAGGLGTGDYVVLDLDGNEGIGTPTESTSGSMIDIFDGNDADGELAGKRLPKVGHANTIICGG